MRRFISIVFVMIFVGILVYAFPSEVKGVTNIDKVETEYNLHESADAITSENEIIIPVTQDTYAKEQFWYGSPFRSKSIFLGYDSTINHQRTRPYLDYDLSILRDLGISENEISSAELMLYKWRALSGTDNLVLIYPVIESWEAVDVDWQFQPAVTEGHLDMIITQDDGWKSLDITNIVTNQLNHALPEYGVMIKRNNEYDTADYYCSIDAVVAEYPDFCSSELHPYIKVTLKTETERVLKQPLLQLDSVTDNSISLSWQTEDADVNEWQLQYVNGDEDFSSAISVYLEDGFATLENLSSDTYHFRVRSYIGSLASEWSETLSVEIKAQENEPIPEDINNENTKNVEKEPKSDVNNSSVLGIQNENLETKLPDETFGDGNPRQELNNFDVRLPEIKGVKKEVEIESDNQSQCAFKYNYTDKTLKTIWCSLPTPVITEVQHTQINNKKWAIRYKMEQPRRLLTMVQYVKCKEKSLWDPITWFGCREEKVKTEEYSQAVDYSFIMRVHGRNYPTYHMLEIDENFYDIYFDTNKNLSDQDSQIFALTIFSMKLDEKEWLDFNRATGLSINKTIPKSKSLPNLGRNKPFSFMFNKLINVTQWHGYTNFQSPHTGIDFASVKENLYAVGDGIIESKMWDTYGKKCNSGGNVMRIKHDNGMHSVYMHLAEDYDGEITNLGVGDRVYAGDLIGKTSNSGQYNCQPLGYHLHFELRNGRYQRTHVDPVNFIDVDWDNIITANARNIPTRLSGDNPHPGY